MDIILLTDYRGLLRQNMKAYQSLDKLKILEFFKKNGVNLIEYNYEDIVNCNAILENKIMLHTSSQNMEYKKYIDDILYSLSQSNTLIPRYESF